MREKSFRAWDKNTESMIYNPLVFPELYPTESLMEFIGVNDKDGDPIYEDDYIDGIDPSGEKIEAFTVCYSTAFTGYFFDYDGEYYSIGLAIDLGFELKITGNEHSSL